MKKLDKNGNTQGCYPKSLEQRRKIAKSLTGRKIGPLSRKTALKISRSLKSSERHRKHSEEMRGVPRSKSIRMKISRTRRCRGLGGLMPSEFAKALYLSLGEGWSLEYRIYKGLNTGEFYSIDIANQDFRIGIECDGKYHEHKSQKAKDKKKDSFMRKLGWSITRIKEYA